MGNGSGGFTRQTIVQPTKGRLYENRNIEYKPYCWSAVRTCTNFNGSYLKASRSHFEKPVFRRDDECTAFDVNIPDFIVPETLE